MPPLIKALNSARDAGGGATMLPSPPKIFESIVIEYLANKSYKMMRLQLVQV
jgi:hypothetical protein